MGASVYVGRVGGLAVALGVGAAVATGHGVALAQTESSSSTSETSASAGADAGSAQSSSDTSTSTPSAGTQTAAEDEDVADTENVAEVADEDPQDPDETESTDQEPEPEAVEEETVVEETTTGGDGSVGESQEPDPVASTIETAPTADLAARTVDTDQTDVDTDTVEADDVAVSAASTLRTAPDQDVAVVAMAAPVAAAAAAAPAAQPFLQRAVVNLLSSLGVGALASRLPGAPLWSPFVTALLGLGSRREFTQPVTALSKTVDTTPVPTLTLANLAAAAVAVTYPGTVRKPVSLSTNTHFIEFVTGANNLNNTISRFGIGGTDLGIMWDNGIEDDPTTAVDEHQVLIAFGDTFSNANPVRTGVWRFNTLFRSPDDVLTNGLYVPNGIPFDDFSGSPMERPNWSDPILPSPGQPVHPPYAIGPEVTIIPTAGVSTPFNNAYGARQYMSFMSIRSWDTAGRWTTNYAGVAFSDDNGQTWRIAPTSIRTAAVGRATVPFVSGNQNFQQGAFLTPPAGSPEADQGWVYSYGTPSGRAGTVYLSRVQQDRILDTASYQYWNGTGWTANTPSAAKPLLPSKTTSFFGFFKSTTYPSVSEMSVQYNPYLKKYVMLYGDSSNKIVMRTATSPEGTWSAPTTLVSSWRVPSLYAPYIHPWSGTDNVSAAEQQYLYWNLSTYNDYQVRFMRTDLTKV